MRKFIAALFLTLALSSCKSPQSIPEVAFKGTTVEELADKPDRELMLSLPAKQKLSYGDNNGKAAIVISNNNLRAQTAERRLEDLQQYVCNLFKEPVGEVCKTRQESK